MVGRIKILELDQNDEPQVPQGLEYGISLNRFIPPVTQQMSNVFNLLADGTYYIWWREVGAEWNENQVMKDVVLCQNLENNAAAIQAYFDQYVWPVVQQTQAQASAAVQDLDSHNFKANDTSVAITAAIHATEDYSYLELEKIVMVFVDGQQVPWLNAVPGGGDTTTGIFNDAGVIKWKASVTGYELTSNQVITFVSVV
ncbi:hypothetical protein [Jiulongibacter sediminis]|uniref:hypothetical protein n=1 Tax=Jiulongibacter sediminis TaxID=1605367 RepID=UPI0026E9F301|nr:hypothetical protein [Jiulongibacter sediminis]